MRIMSLLFIVFHVISAYASTTSFEWEPLIEGGKIHIVAPSYGSEDTKTHLKTAIAYIEKNGFVAEAPDDLIIPQPLGYANTREFRRQHLRDVFFSETVEVVWAIRGGRGASSITMALENLPVPVKPKRILGFSDTTALHLLAAKWGWPSLHCPVLAYHQDGAHAVNKQTSLRPIFDILTGKTQEVSYQLTPLNRIAQEYEGTIDSQVRGGNASLIQRKLGTPLHLKTESKILFLEDTGEVGTKFAEIMTHFQDTGLFKGVDAVILGDFEEGLTEAQPSDLMIAKQEFLDDMTDLKIPVLESTEFGHGDVNHPLPFGTPAHLEFQGPDKVNLRVSATGRPLKEAK